jgi:Plasmid pRiA4b ORF-3-like protein
VPTINGTLLEKDPEPMVDDAPDDLVDDVVGDVVEQSNAPRVCRHCGAALRQKAGPGRDRLFCDATCRSRARRARTRSGRAHCSVRAGPTRCTTAATGTWYDTAGRVAAHSCAAHRELVGELLRTAKLPQGRTLDRWLPATVRWTPHPPAAPIGPAYVLRVELVGVYPPIWRRVHVRADITLTELHNVLQIAMGWQAMHLWRFGPWHFDQVGGEFPPARPLSEVLVEPGRAIGYLYDFGDDWEHRVQLEKIINRPRVSSVLPRCTGGKRACPPEDSGGWWGYEQLLKALRARKGWRYHQARELAGTRFNPETVDLTEINTQLAALTPA